MANRKHSWKITVKAEAASEFTWTSYYESSGPVAAIAQAMDFISHRFNISRDMVTSIESSRSIVNIGTADKPRATTNDKEVLGHGA